MTRDRLGTHGPAAPASAPARAIGPGGARSVLRVSTRAMDPTSWYSTSNHQLVLGLLTAAVSIALIAVNCMAVDVAGQAVALALMLIAFLLLRSGGDLARPSVRAVSIIAPTALSTLALIVSALSLQPDELPLAAWWAPLAAAAVLASSIPYCSAITALLITLAPVLAMSVASVLLWAPEGGSEAVEVVMSAVVVIASVGIAGAVFTVRMSMAIVAWGRGAAAHDVEVAAAVAAEQETTALIDAPARPLRGEDAADAAGCSPRDAGLVSLVNEAAAFVLDTVARDSIGDAERTRAREFALRLRERLVSRMNRTWLHDIDASITVVDPNHRAEQIPVGQRVALRGLLERALTVPEYRPGSMRVDLAIDGQGMTVVAIGLDLDLPEGRRRALLAPQLLSLRSVVSEFEWLRGHGVRMRFRVPSAGSADAHLPE